MKIAYLHGLESTIDPKDPKIIWLNNNFKEVYTPQINYKDDSTFDRLYKDIKSLNPDIIVGSSMGGYVSYLIGRKLSIPVLLFNPAVVGRSFDPVVDDSNLKRTKIDVMFGKSDTVINGKSVRKYFRDNGVAFNHSGYDGGHRVPEDVFINSIKGLIGIKEIYSVQNNIKMMKHVKLFEQFVNEKASLSQMKKDIKTKEYKEVSQAINNAEEVADIWNMLDPKMFKFTESEFEDIFDDWWNNISRYDSVADFSRNAFMEDVHSLYLHLLPYVSESVVTEAKRRLSFKDAGITSTMDLSTAIDALRVADISWDQKGQSFTFDSPEDLETAREVLQLEESIVTEGREANQFGIESQHIGKLQKGKMSKYTEGTSMPFGLISRPESGLSDTDKNLVKDYVNADNIVLGFYPMEDSNNDTMYDAVKSGGIKVIEDLVSKEYGLKLIETIKGKRHCAGDTCSLMHYLVFSKA